MASTMANFSLPRIPVMDVLNCNMKDVWPDVISAIKDATFVAVDLELSGIGDRKKLNAKSVEDRYLQMCAVARTRAVLSLGVSCFKLQDNNDRQSTRCMGYTVQTYNVMLLCSENYVVEPASLRFLVRHGFDFNTQSAEGISYYRGPDQSETSVKTDPLRQLFAVLMMSGRPLVVHNGLVDLVFLYQNFYTSLPQSMATFLADLEEVFTGGVFDTKYMTEFKARYSASFLEYVFRRCERENQTCASSGHSCHVVVTPPEFPCDVPHVVYMEAGSTSQPGVTHDNVCGMFGSFGFCNEGYQCTKSHNVEWILDNEEEGFIKKREKRKRRRQHQQGVTQTTPNSGTDSGISHIESDNSDISSSKTDKSSDDMNMDTESVAVATEQESRDSNVSLLKEQSGTTEGVRSPATRESRGHRAGFDAFMTGYIFAFFISQYGQMKDLPDQPSFSDFKMDAFRNKLALNGKDVPLTIMKSNFAKTSKEHRTKMERLMHFNR